MTAGVLVHEWLSTHGGSENVFDVLVDAYPDADLLCLWSDVENRYPGRELHETWLARSPLRHHKPVALPLMVPTWRGRRSRSYDWALVSSHLFAHHVSFAGLDVPKYVYVHSPARYLWNPELDTRGAGALVRAVAPTLRRIDRRRAQEPVSLAANSRFVAARVERAWGRQAGVIHPPVDVARIQAELAAGPLLADAEQRLLDALPQQFLLGASRFVPYKRLDLVVRTGELLELPVVVAGSGPQEAELRALADQASVPVTVVRRPSTPLLCALYRRASVFVFPPVEDFGIMPVEALAAGTPVVVSPVGGAREIVDGTAAGVVAGSTEPVDLAAAVVEAMGLSARVCQERAAQFATPVFVQRIDRWLAADGVPTPRPAPHPTTEEVG